MSKYNSMRELSKKIFIVKRNIEFTNDIVEFMGSDTFNRMELGMIESLHESCMNRLISIPAKCFKWNKPEVDKRRLKRYENRLRAHSYVIDSNWPHCSGRSVNVSLDQSMGRACRINNTGLLN